MKITVWGINYAPEPAGIAPYNTQLCAHLKRNAHDVCMVASFPYYPAWRNSRAMEDVFFALTLATACRYIVAGILCRSDRLRSSASCTKVRS